jgi:hypothetical protein
MTRNTIELVSLQLLATYDLAPHCSQLQLLSVQCPQLAAAPNLSCNCAGSSGCIPTAAAYQCTTVRASKGPIATFTVQKIKVTTTQFPRRLIKEKAQSFPMHACSVVIRLCNTSTDASIMLATKRKPTRSNSRTVHVSSTCYHWRKSISGVRGVVCRLRLSATETAR